MNEIIDDPSVSSNGCMYRSDDSMTQQRLMVVAVDYKTFVRTGHLLITKGPTWKLRAESNRTFSAIWKLLHCTTKTNEYEYEMI